MLLEALIESNMVAVGTAKETARVILDFVDRREAKIVTTAAAFRSQAAMDKRLSEIDNAASKASKHAAEARKANADKAKKAKADAEAVRAKALQDAEQAVAQTGWVKHAGKGAAKWKDPTTGLYVPTMEAYVTILARRAGVKA